MIDHGQEQQARVRAEQRARGQEPGHQGADDGAGHVASVDATQPRAQLTPSRPPRGAPPRKGRAHQQRGGQHGQRALHGHQRVSVFTSSDEDGIALKLGEAVVDDAEGCQRDHRGHADADLQPAEASPVLSRAPQARS